MIKLVKNKLFLSLVILVSVLTTMNINTYAQEVNDRIGSIKVEANSNKLNITEQWKIVLDTDDINRTININPKYINNISVQQVFPIKENLNYTINSNTDISNLTIDLSNSNGLEVLVSINYTVECNKALNTKIQNGELTNILYPSNNPDITKLTIDMKSDMVEFEDYHNSLLSLNEVEQSSTKEAVTNKEQSSGKDIEKDSNVAVTALLTVIKFIAEIALLIICTGGLLLLAYILYLLYIRNKNIKKKKFYSTTKKIQKRNSNKKKSFK